MTESNQFENRVLVLMPTGRDGSLVCATLEKAGIRAEVCAEMKSLTDEIGAGAGAVLLAEEALKKDSLEQLFEQLEAQPVWSDLPIVLFAGNASNAEMLAATVGTRFNATIVERPIRIPILISAVRGAIRARQRQYESRNLMNQLAESDHQKDLFLATLSHELRTPLNSILGWTQLLRKDSQRIDINRGLEVIERNAKTQSEIISDILFVSRIITGKLSLNLKPTNLIPVLNEAIEGVLPSIQEKKIHLNTVFDHKIGRINGDVDRLKQIFWNILSNAIKFTPAHGRIDVRASVVGTNYEIEISDSGDGIEQAFLPFIFERFRQADSTTTRKAGGLGLGLAIVHHLVEIHGGQISAHNGGINTGATFVVRFPILSADQAADKTVSASACSKSQNLNGFPDNVHILLVEDNDDSREMLKFFFNQHKIKITAVTSAAEAFDVILENKPDILISDIGMPDEDGYSLIRKVRELAPDKGGRIPAIALTGYASTQDRDLAIEAGYQEHSSKPIEVDNLIELIKNLLKNSSSD